MPAFAIDVMLPLAQAAYDVAGGGNPVLPAGFNVTGKIALYEHVGHGVLLDGGFTLDVARDHNLQQSYLPGLKSCSRPRALR